MGMHLLIRPLLLAMQEHQRIYDRDLPLMAAMGVNAIRIYVLDEVTWTEPEPQPQPQPAPRGKPYPYPYTYPYLCPYPCPCP